MRTVLRTFSIEHRTVLVLRYFADLTDTQIAEALGLPVGTVKSRLARALDWLSRDERIAALAGEEWGDKRSTRNKPADSYTRPAQT